MKSIATLGSHCALQVLKGAKDESFNTIVITRRSRERLYRRFTFIDDFIVVGKFSDMIEEPSISQLVEKDSILIPHGTLISEVGVERVDSDLKIPIFGNKAMLRWEADRDMKEKLMRESGLRTPKIFSSPDEIDRLVIAKLPGAMGGLGYFLANDSTSYSQSLDRLITNGLLKGDESIQIQEYVLGVPVYLQFFYSPLKHELELVGIDRRYETNVDGIGRLPSNVQESIDLHPGYVVVGNSPLVLRESLLDEAYGIGEGFVDACKRLVPPGMIGPFCIEGVYDGDGNFIAFEFSGRIVAGTNLYVGGSPYSDLIYDKPVSMGRRIAMEIRDGMESRSLNQLVT